MDRDIRQIWFSEKNGKSFDVVNYYVCNNGNHALRSFSDCTDIGDGCWRAG